MKPDSDKYESVEEEGGDVVAQEPAEYLLSAPSEELEIPPDLVEEAARLAEVMSEGPLTEVSRAVVERLGESRLIDLAARTAACHPGLQGQDRSLRSLLAVEASWRDLVEQVAGEPRQILDFDQLADDSLKQARIAGEAISIIWDEELLTSSEVARRLGASPSNREKVSVNRRRSLLLGLPRDGGKRYLFPSFQIDAARQQIFPEVREVNRLLEASADPWGVASWWVTMNGRLGSKPMDLVGTTQAQALVEAAKAVIEPLG